MSFNRSKRNSEDNAWVLYLKWYAVALFPAGIPAAMMYADTNLVAIFSAVYLYFLTSLTRKEKGIATAIFAAVLTVYAYCWLTMKGQDFH